ncbi:MAG: alpha/beta hydrolase [Flavobacteriaceae bacterium]|nr:alpha/beta hydrolase [Flavobacteriaceae bacterium]
MDNNSTSEIQKKYNITIHGNGEQPLLFAHGYGCDQHMWRFVYPEFTDDYKVVLFDYIGAGKADHSFYSEENYDSLQGYADDVIEICEALELKDPIFVGHSVSSMIGGLAAIKQPSLFSKMVMIGPSPRYINDNSYTGGFEEADIQELMETLESNYLGWSSAMAPVIMGNPDRPELGEELTNSFCRTDPKIAKNFARVTFLSDNREDLKRIEVPTLVLQCSEDIIAPEVVGRYVAEEIPDATLKILSATGHCPNLSAPEETVEAIKEFL